MENFQLIRGERILQQLELLEEEVTTTELDRWTQNFVPSTKPRQERAQEVQIIQMQLIPMQGQRNDGQLKVEAKARSKTKVYSPMMLFSGVIYEDEDQPTNISFQAANGEEYHALPIELAKSNVQVRCDCLDFYHRFAYWNKSKVGLYGNPMPPYVRKTQHYPRVNPEKVPGMCKHLIAAVNELKTLDLVR